MTGFECVLLGLSNVYGRDTIIKTILKPLKYFAVSRMQ